MGHYASEMGEPEPRSYGFRTKYIGWRTMDTAPKDGTTVIICAADAEEPDPCMAHFRDGKWICTTKEDWDAGAPEFREYAWWLKNPTHWMPRPAPPSV